MNKETLTKLATAIQRLDDLKLEISGDDMDTAAFIACDMLEAGKLAMLPTLLKISMMKIYEN